MESDLNDAIAITKDRMPWLSETEIAIHLRMIAEKFRDHYVNMDVSDREFFELMHEVGLSQQPIVDDPPPVEQNRIDFEIFKSKYRR